MNKILNNINDSHVLANIPALQGNSKLYDGSTSYDIVENWSQFEYTQPVTIFMVLEFFTSSEQCLFSNFKGISSPNVFAVYRFYDKIYYDMANDFNVDSQRKDAFSKQKLKIGKVAFAICLGGSGNALDDEIVNNQYNSGILINRNNLSGSIINDAQKLIIGRGGISVGFSYVYAKWKKFQIVNFKANSSQLNILFNDYNCQSIANDSQFLLDIDFNKTSGNPLTTRVGTPFYNITPMGSNTFVPYI